MDSTLSASIVAGSALMIVEFGKIAYKRYEIKHAKKRMAKDMSESTSKDVLIKAELAKLERYGFNRVSVIEYHNGVTTVGGISLKKASMTHEWTDKHTPGIIKEFQNVPCSIAAEMLEELETTTYGFVMVDDESAVESIAISHRMYGVRQAYNFRIGERLVDGCLSCIFTNETRFFEHEDILDIRAIATRIFLIKNKNK